MVLVTLESHLISSDLIFIFLQKKKRSRCVSSLSSFLSPGGVGHTLYGHNHPHFIKCGGEPPAGAAYHQISGEHTRARDRLALSLCLYNGCHDGRVHVNLFFTWQARAGLAWRRVRPPGFTVRLPGLTVRLPGFTVRLLVFTVKLPCYIFKKGLDG